MAIHPVIIEEGRDKHYHRLGDHRIAYLTSGDPAKPPLVMVHGWLSHAGFWRQTMQQLDSHFYCIAVDLLGHGHSDKPLAADYSIPAAAARVLALLDALGIGRFAYMGHSMGGFIGKQLAGSIARDRVTRFVDVAGVTTGRLSRYVRTVILPTVIVGRYLPAVWNLSRVGMRYAWYRQIYSDNVVYFTRHFSEFDSASIQMSIQRGVEVPTHHEARGIMTHDTTPLLDKITAPTLIVFGAQDNTVPVIEGQHALKHIPDARLLIYEHCGHIPMEEQPEQFFTDVRTFLIDEAKDN